MKLYDILSGLDYNLIPENVTTDYDICDIVYDSRNAKPGTVFVAIAGETLNGHKFIKNAYDNGCRTFVITEDLQPLSEAVYIKVDNARIALSEMSCNFFENPSKDLKIIGVTGTKGKTTITTSISQILNSCGISTGLIGTNGASYSDKTIPTSNTTPESYELQKIFREMLDAGIKCVCMEVSSGGLMMHRVDNVEFDIALFTNISPDHIGPKEHPTFEDYLNCKARLFSLAKVGIINYDDEYAEYIRSYATEHGCRALGFAIKNKSANLNADFIAKDIAYHESLETLGSDFTCEDHVHCSEYRYTIHMPGAFSVYNGLAFIAVCRLLDIEEKSIADAMTKIKVDGRIEIINTLPYATVVLDYAHNKTSLENILTSLRAYKPNRLICLFGSVGGRTKLRRKQLGEVASQLCDFCIITSEDPRDEDPQQIIDDITAEFKEGSCPFITEVDRKTAIFKAVDMLEPGDILILAGKGAETYMYIDGKKIDYDERACAQAAIEARLEKDKKQ